MQKKTYPALDGLRALCIVFTLLNHTHGHPWFVNGTVGVDVFFALSGYLITMLLVREQEESNYICLPCFYVRRIFRIVPLYYLTIGLYAIATYASSIVHGDMSSWSTFLNATPYLISFMSEFRPDAAGEAFGHAWTLGIEEKYYILWPILFVLSSRLRYGLSIGVVLFLAAAALTFDDLNLRGYLGLLAGSLLALAVESRKPILRPLVTQTPMHVFAFAVVAGYAACTIVPDDRLNLLVSIPSAFLISALIHQHGSVYERVLAHPILWRVGQLTYGIYLIHRLPAHLFEEYFERIGFVPHWTLEFGLVYASSILIALMLKRLVEDPFIRIGRGYSKVLKSRPPPAVEMAGRRPYRSDLRSPTEPLN